MIGSLFNSKDIQATFFENFVIYQNSYEQRSSSCIIMLETAKQPELGSATLKCSGRYRYML